MEGISSLGNSESWQAQKLRALKVFDMCFSDHAKGKISHLFNDDGTLDIQFAFFSPPLVIAGRQCLRLLFLAKLCMRLSRPT